MLFNQEILSHIEKVFGYKIKDKTLYADIENNWYKNQPTAFLGDRLVGLMTGEIINDVVKTLALTEDVEFNIVNIIHMSVNSNFIFKTIVERKFKKYKKDFNYRCEHSIGTFLETLMYVIHKDVGTRQFKRILIETFFYESKDNLTLYANVRPTVKELAIIQDVVQIIRKGARKTSGYKNNPVNIVVVNNISLGRVKKNSQLKKMNNMIKCDMNRIMNEEAKEVNQLILKMKNSDNIFNFRSRAMQILKEGDKSKQLVKNKVPKKTVSNDVTKSTKEPIGWADNLFGKIKGVFNGFKEEFLN